MKAYELMNALSEVNAGAEVRVSFSMTKDMFLESGKPIEKGEGLRCFLKDIEDVDFVNEWNVNLEL